MGLFSKDNATPEAVADFLGEAMSRALAPLSRGETLAPYGRERKAGLIGDANNGAQFVVGDAPGQIDLQRSIDAAVQWLDDAATRADMSAIVFDGFLNTEEQGRVDALIGRAVSLKTGMMAEVALPYHKGDGAAGFAISDPKFRFSGAAADDAAAQQVNVDPTAFDAAFRNALARGAPQIS